MAWGCIPSSQRFWTAVFDSAGWGILSSTDSWGSDVGFGWLHCFPSAPMALFLLTGWYTVSNTTWLPNKGLDWWTYLCYKSPVLCKNCPFQYCDVTHTLCFFSVLSNCFLSAQHLFHPRGCSQTLWSQGSPWHYSCVHQSGPTELEAMSKWDLVNYSISFKDVPKVLWIMMLHPLFIS